ncbi:MAG: pre-peptidase C-terminal domain-containing protein [Bradymonadia bacterium]
MITLLSFACTSGEVLLLEPVPNQVAQVGVQLDFDLVVYNGGGNAPRFRVSSETIPDLGSRPTAPRFVPFDGTGAVFQWTPLGKDVGDHRFRITAESAGESSSIDVFITVRAGNSAPQFIRPLGSGTTIDLENGAACFEVPVQVQDADSTNVQLSLAQPTEAGYVLEQMEPFSGNFKWCPNENQLATRDRFLVNFVADDGDGHVTRKAFSLLVRRRLGEDCPGRVPTLEHMLPMQMPGSNTVEIVVRISDDIGISEMPRIYFTFDPALVNQRNLDVLSVESTERISGTELDGIYSARIAIPGVEAGAAAAMSLYYFVEVTDNDDLMGTCDHRASEPSEGFHQVSVTPTETVTAEVCSECTDDGQCGSGLCITLAAGERRCLETCEQTSGVADANCSEIGGAGCCMGQFLLFCEGQEAREVNCGSADACGWNTSAQRYDCRADTPSDPSGLYPRACGSTSNGCDDGFSCSLNSALSVSGQASHVCMPATGDCGGGCVDDSFEENDSINSVLSPIPQGQTLTELKLCGDGQSVDPDYFGVFLERGHQLTATARFVHALGDVDMSLLNSDGRLVATSVSSTDDEAIIQCLEPGFYYLHFWSIDRAINNSYDVDVSLSDEGCCRDDPAEEDDGPNSATNAVHAQSFANRRICPGNQDWYRIVLQPGERLVVDVLFDHFANEDDLDVYVYDRDGQTNLTPCCNITNGQSATSDEHLEYAVSEAGTYYVVVGGYRDAQNDYAISFEVQADNQTPPSP